MTAPWREPEMHEWAKKFVDEERQAGRTYSMIQTGTESRPGGSVTSFRLISSDPPVSADEFRRVVTEFMKRHEWDKDGGIGPWEETMEMAIMTYIEDQQSGRV